MSWMFLGVVDPPSQIQRLPTRLNARMHRSLSHLEINVNPCPATPRFIVFENSEDPNQLTEPDDQDTHSYLLYLAVHAYNVNAVC